MHVNIIWSDFQLHDRTRLPLVPAHSDNCRSIVDVAENRRRVAASRRQATCRNSRAPTGRAATSTIIVYRFIRRPL